METKKILLMAGLILGLSVTSAWAGQTTISGPSQCMMPVILGFNTPYPQTTDAQGEIQKQPSEPVVEGASDRTILDREEKSASQEEDSLTLEERLSTGKETITVYTIYEK